MVSGLEEPLGSAGPLWTLGDHGQGGSWEISWGFWEREGDALGKALGHEFSQELFREPYFWKKVLARLTEPLLEKWPESVYEPRVSSMLACVLPTYLAVNARSGMRKKAIPQLTFPRFA